MRAENGAVGTAVPAFRTDRCAVLTLAACLTVRAAVLTQAAFRTEDTTGTVQAGIAIRTQIGTILADIGTERTHACTVRTAAADVTVSKAVRTVGTFAAVGAYLSALVADHSADNADYTALVAHVSALRADIGAVGTHPAVLTVTAVAGETTGAVVNVGTDPFGTVAAPFTVAAPLLGAFETDLAAALADQCDALFALVAVLADFHTFAASSALFARVGVAFGAAHTVRAERLAVAAHRLACGTECDAFASQYRESVQFSHLPQPSHRFVAQSSQREHSGLLHSFAQRLHLLSHSGQIASLQPTHRPQPSQRTS